jgi:hypothetical protein
MTDTTDAFPVGSILLKLKGAPEAAPAPGDPHRTLPTTTVPNWKRRNDSRLPPPDIPGSCQTALPEGPVVVGAPAPNGSLIVTGGCLAGPPEGPVVVGAPAPDGPLIVTGPCQTPPPDDPVEVGVPAPGVAGECWCNPLVWFCNLVCESLIVILSELVFVIFGPVLPPGVMTCNFT